MSSELSLISRPDQWDISEKDFPKNEGITRKLRFIINYAILAPSSHNSQPWLFKIVNSMIELYADMTRAIPIVDPEDRELIISCGAALFNLRLALRRFGYTSAVDLFPNPGVPDLLARIRIGEKVVEAEDEHYLLFEAITKRHTNRMPFEKKKVPEEVLSELRAMATVEGCWLNIVEGEDYRNALADLIAEGDHIQGANRQFRRELAAWVHPNRTRSHDGMPGYSLGIGDIASYAGPLIIRTFDWGKGQAAKDRQLAAGSPVLAVLGSDAETPIAWLKTGQALERVLLRAQAANVSASYLNQPIEVPELRTRVHDLLKRNGYPQLILRMGYGHEPKPTPRRPVSEVLL